MADVVPILVVLFVFLALVVLLVARMACSIRPYEAGLVTVLGSYRRCLTPGFSLVHPLAKVQRVDLRTRVRRVAPRPVPVIGGTVNVGGEVSFRVEDAPRAAFQTQDLDGSIGAAVRAAIVDSLTGRDLARDGSEGFRLAPLARDTLDQTAARFGVKVESVTLRLER